ncbi:MAG: nucleotide exchange factor GrpE [Anaerolineales bacterium]|jgi:molecular chaperone GrpE
MKEEKQGLDDMEQNDQEILAADQAAEHEVGVEGQAVPLRGSTELPEGNMTMEEQLQMLESSLEDITDKAEEYLDGWQRSRAEFANYKKRIQKENLDIRQTARGEVIKVYLDVLDDLERALQKKPGDSGAQDWVAGIEIIYQKLKARLEAEGIRPMNALGMEFDPHVHEALMKEETEDYPSGTVIEVMQEGYWIGDRVLRPALVRVAA